MGCSVDVSVDPSIVQLTTWQLTERQGERGKRERERDQQDRSHCLFINLMSEVTFHNISHIQLIRSESLCSVQTHTQGRGTQGMNTQGEDHSRQF